MAEQTPAVAQCGHVGDPSHRVTCSRTGGCTRDSRSAADAAEQQQADPVPPEPSSYSADGRRDPFVSLLSRGADLRPNINRPTGLGGLSISEVSLRGIFRSQGTVVAIVQSPDNKTYLVHSGDRLLDGVVGSVGDGSVVFLQEVNDPLSLVKQREVRKALRAAAEER